ncbi:hypothetical protein N7470_010200 [Penicillium chermesinum]|nr:hypothetical protein N7470_010200 [Penicillium chermesinum]
MMWPPLVPVGIVTLAPTPQPQSATTFPLNFAGCGQCQPPRDAPEERHHFRRQCRRRDRRNYEGRRFRLAPGLAPPQPWGSQGTGIQLTRRHSWIQFISFKEREQSEPGTSDSRKASPSNSDSADGKASNGRNRRASEGAQSKTDGKRIPADLRCDRCGKGWEHDPAWAITLETPYLQAPAGSAPRGCYSAGHDEPGRPGTLAGSRFRSFLPSPDASSEVHDGLSSAETTPPPMDEQDEDDDFEMSGVPTNWTKRPSISNASAFSRSYQSIPSSSYNDSAPLHSPTFSHFRQSSVDTRPSTADTKLHEDDEADLAAAIGLCNFGTPRTVPVSVTPDVPPVPPLPARYLDAGSHPGNRSASFAHSGPQSEAFRRGSNADMFLSPSSLNPSLSYKVSDMRGAPTGEAEARNGRQRRNADVDFGSRTGPVDDDDDGVFGRMEE